MAVSKHKNGKTYSYKFYLPGHPKPFRGSTGEKTKAKAEQAEARIRARIVAEMQGLPIERGKRLPAMTLLAAVERFYEEKAQFEANHKTVFGQLNRLVDFFGEHTPLHHITTDDMTRYQTERRKDGVANRTINAEVPELISRLYKRAKKLWKVDVGEPIEWGDLKLTLPQHRTRAASRAERIILLRSLRMDYRPIIRFALMSGLRRTALLLKRNQLDWDYSVLTYGKKSKHTGDKGWLPITPEMETLLKREIEKGGEFCKAVFTYECKRSRGGRVKGQRYPITVSGLTKAMTDAVKKAGLEDWRLIHDLRHTAATETLRSSQNLAAVQGMLGHSDIAQTSRYAHVLLDDVRRAMITPKLRPATTVSSPLQRQTEESEAA